MNMACLTFEWICLPFDPIFALSYELFFQAELNKVVAENGPAGSGVQTDEKKINQGTTTTNSKHHSLLLQVNKF